MKLYYPIIIFLTFQLLYCIELTGIKFEVNEEMANAALLHFYQDINRVIREMEIEDIHIATGVNIRDIKVGISNFTPDKVKFTFRESGININISGLKANIFVRAYISNCVIPFTKHATADINSFSLDANIRVKSKTVNGKMVPDAEFIETPKHDIDLDVNIGGFMLGLNGLLESIAEKEIKKAINNFIENKSNDFLKKALEKIPMEICVDESKGYCIDYSLVNPIIMKNGYLEVNSYALLYNKNKPKTQKKNRIPLTYIPNISKVGNQYQLYISEYSINSALFTLFSTENLSLSINSNTITPILLSIILPGINEKYGNQKLKLDFEVTKEGSLEFSEDGINAKIFGQIIIKIEDSGEVIFQCDSEISTDVELFIKEGISITGKIHSLAIKVGAIPINKSSSKVLIEHNINTLIYAILPIINNFIADKIQLTLPIFFKNIDIQHKNHYLTVNYALKKEDFTIFTTYLIGNVVKKYLENIFLENDSNKIKYELSFIIREINNYRDKFFSANYNIKNQINRITNAILKIADEPNDTRKAEISLTEFRNELEGMNKYLKHKILDFSSLSQAIWEFTQTNIPMSRVPDFYKQQSSSDSYRAQLRPKAVIISCRVDNILFQMLNHDSDYFTWAKFDFDQCLNNRNLK